VKEEKKRSERERKGRERGKQRRYRRVKKRRQRSVIYIWHFPSSTMSPFLSGSLAC
jgi:hypothetical protein